MKRIWDVSFELSLNDSLRWANRLLEHDYLEASSRNFDPTYELIRHQIKARLEMIDGHFDRAVSIFATYLDVDIPDLKLDSSIKNPGKIKEHAHENTEEISKDYRDLGRALIKSSLPNNRGLAISVWKRGLQIPNTRGNQRFLEDIKRDLETQK